MVSRNALNSCSTRDRPEALIVCRCEDDDAQGYARWNLQGHLKYSCSYAFLTRSISVHHTCTHNQHSYHSSLYYSLHTFDYSSALSSAFCSCSARSSWACRLSLAEHSASLASSNAFLWLSGKFAGSSSRISSEPVMTACAALETLSGSWGPYRSAESFDLALA